MQPHQSSTLPTERLTTSRHQGEDRSSLQKQDARLRDHTHEATRRNSWATPGKWGSLASTPNQLAHHHIFCARKARKTKLTTKPPNRFQGQEGASVEVTWQQLRRGYPDPDLLRSGGNIRHGST